MTMAGPTHATYRLHDCLVAALIHAAQQEQAEADAALRRMLLGEFRDARPDQVYAAMQEACARLEARIERLPGE